MELDDEIQPSATPLTTFIEVGVLNFFNSPIHSPSSEPFQPIPFTQAGFFHALPPFVMEFFSSQHCGSFVFLYFARKCEKRAHRHSKVEKYIKIFKIYSKYIQNIFKIHSIYIKIFKIYHSRHQKTTHVDIQQQ